MIVVRRRTGGWYVKLPAQIDEENQLASLPARLGAGTVIIDFSEVVRINSCGVRDWVRCISGIKQAGGRSIFVACSPAAVAQMNSVNNFTEGASVKSLVTPYFCPACDRERPLMCEAIEVLGGPPFEPPVKRCDDCDGAMDFDDIPEAYFEFLTSTPRYQPTAEIERLLDELGRPTESTSIRRRVGSTRTPRGLAAVVNPLSTAGSEETLPEADVLRPLPVVNLPSPKETLETLPRVEASHITHGPGASVSRRAPPASRFMIAAYIAAGVALVAIGLLAAALLR